MHFSNPLEDKLGYHLRRASGTVLSHLADGLNEFDLRYTEASVLIMIEANPGIKQRDIGMVLGIKSANMAPLVALLAKRGLIERQPLDGRSHGLHLSEEGQCILRQVWKCIDANEAWVLPDLSASERETLVAHLQAIWR